MDVLIIAPISGIVSIVFAIYLLFYVIKQDAGTPKMQEISAAINEGAMAYLKRQYMTLGAFVAVMFIILAVFLRFETALVYILGSVCSGISGFLGMTVALKANVRTTSAARTSSDKAFPIAFYGGAVMGLSVVGMALLGISAIYYIFPDDPTVIFGFSLGASAVALFAKAGGGIYTKTADIGADLVGKVEAGIPEDDPRNPAVIADNVGDNVGDVAGTGADLFDSYVGSIVAAMAIGIVVLGTVGVVLPILLAAMGIFASIVGTLFVRGKPSSALNKGTFSTCGIFAILAYLMINYLNIPNGLGIFSATIAGLIAGIVIGITSDYFTSISSKPVKNIAEAAQTGAAINILSGFSYGLLSVIPPIIGICIATVAAWSFAGTYGIAMSAVGMLSVTGIIVASDAYGPIVDNAKGIAEMSNLGDEVVDAADRLDAVGNTAKAITKGFAIGAAALTVLSLFSAYNEAVGIESLDLTNPYVMVGVFAGAFMPPLFSALTILAVGNNAFKMVEEVRRQFKEIPGIMEGTGKPDYAKCVDIATKGALTDFIVPSVLTIAITLAVGLTLGKYALGGFLAGSIVTGIVFALMMANAGGAWDNAKKYIEEGNLGGKGSDTHKAAVIGDTVGDPFKDTAGPSLNTLIVVISLVASVFAPLVLKYALFD